MSGTPEALFCVQVTEEILFEKIVTDFIYLLLFCSVYLCGVTFSWVKKKKKKEKKSHFGSLQFFF